MSLLDRIRSVARHRRLRKSAGNAFWLSSEMLVRFLSGFIIGLWIARYLGPESYGRLQYAIAWVGLFNAIAWMGVGQNVVRDLVRADTSEGELLGGTFALRMIGSFLAIVLAIGISTYVVESDASVTTLIWILCLPVPIAEATGGLLIWFQSRMQVRPPVIAKSLVILLGAGYRAALILTQASLFAFAWAVVAEAVVLSGALFGVYRWHGGRVSDWRFRYRSIIGLLRDGFPLIFSTLAAGLNSNISQLMLGGYGSFLEVGIYVAATRFSVIWWVIPRILMVSVAPNFIYPNEMRPQLQRNVSWIGAGLLAIALIPCFVMMFAGELLIGSLLGSDYLGAIPVLTIHIWTAVFIFLDAASSYYLLATDRQSVLITKTVSGLLLNAVLGVILIPMYGAVGAAIATLLAQAWMSCLFYMIHPRVRDVSRIQAASLYQLLWGWWHPKGSS